MTFTRLSVVIVNHNYAQFVADAIDSALAVVWPDVEVIVLDDGSTDNSLEVIRRYSDRVQILERPNRGQRVATNEAFTHVTGEAALFLDSDDVLEPEIAEAAAGVMGAEVSKVQFQMARIDGAGNSLGSTFPDFSPVPTPDSLRHWLYTTGHHPTPPNSGNLYAREFLDRMFPVTDVCGEWTDSALLVAAPVLGDVMTVDRPLVRYRVHGDNDSNLANSDLGYTKHIERAAQRFRLLLQLRGLPESPRTMRPLFRGRPLLQLRVACRRIRPQDQPLPGDSTLRILSDIARSALAPGPERLSKRLAIMAWCLLVMATPRPMALKLIRHRFHPYSTKD